MIAPQSTHMQYPRRPGQGSRRGACSALLKREHRWAGTGFYHEKCSATVQQVPRTSDHRSGSEEVSTARSRSPLLRRGKAVKAVLCRHQKKIQDAVIWLWRTCLVSGRGLVGSGLLPTGQGQAFLGVQGASGISAALCECSDSWAKRNASFWWAQTVRKRKR
jgi:hypothetical protein